MMIKRLLLLATAAVMTVGVMHSQDMDDINLVAEAYCRPGVSLSELTAYMDTATAYDQQVRTFYANLVNNPTHSYRIEHMDVGFNGCTGRVEERITMADGKKRDNMFLFNEQGLLIQSTIQGGKGNKTVVDYTYSFDDRRGYNLKQSKSKNGYIKYVSMFDASDRRETIKGSNGSRQDYTYTDKGHLSKLVVTPAKGDKRTLVYQDGYVVREEVGDRVFRYHYDYDTATGKKFLIAIKELKGTDVLHERTFDYAIDTHGRYTRVTISLDGKLQMTIERNYSF